MEQTHNKIRTIERVDAGMTKQTIILIGILALVLVSGCTDQYYVSKGVVQHTDNLEEARNECIEICDSTTYRATPKLNQCTEKECECLC